VLGGIYQKLNCDKLALSNFEKVLELEPQNLLGHIYIIDQFILMKDFASADKYFNSLNEISPEWFYTFSTGAKLEMLKKNYESSKKYFDKILSSSSEEGYDYAFVLAKLKQKEEADSVLNNELNNYTELIKNSPENSSFLEKNLSDIYALKGNYEQSLKLLNRAVNKGWFEYRINLVYPYSDSLKQNDEFSRIIERMKTKTDSLKFLASKDDPSWINCN
jgi:tetratricopeptide (TPR) repeat protein